jgi:uracil-DNA glycosylase family 4
VSDAAPDPRALLAAHLRQRRELGEAELVLDHLTADEVRAVLASRPAVVPSGPAADPSDARRRPDASPSPDAARRRDEAPSREAVARREEPPRETPQARPSSADRDDPLAARPPTTGPTRVHVPVPGGPPTALGPSMSAEEIGRLPTLDAVCGVASGCPRCGLARTRTQVVFGEGDPAARLMIVGEAPGEREDRSGRPFVGPAGKLLDLLLATVGFPRESVYICNVLKCRPPQNRNPQPDEVAACSPYLLRQVDLVAPRAILAVGTFAAQTLLSTDVTIGKLRGRVHQYRGIPLVPTYHPAALLRSPAWVRATWDDLQRLRAVLDDAA